MAATTTEVPRLKAKYDAEVRAALKTQLGLENVMQVPRFEKIVVNMGVGRAVQQPSLLDGAVSDMTAITGQKPIVNKATKSIAGFKLREGQNIGCKVTLRGVRMYEFLDRLLTIALPRIRDFRGINPKGFDRQGNYSMGIREQIIFPEIDYDTVDTVRGMDIVFTISGDSVDGSRSLLTKFGMPFRKPGQAS